MFSNRFNYRVGDMIIFEQTGEWFTIYDKFDIYEESAKKKGPNSSHWPSYAWKVTWGKKDISAWGSLSGYGEKYGVSCVNLLNMTSGNRLRDNNIVRINAKHPWKKRS